ncbi:hypothetical protein BDB00DRAFT_822676 [Zychaea mexicana]|uniref:uncharacterized protein n=1 Tax=Zychaea mexicana TaxID=64656 RepID=UPI0022FF1A62|nr:uncharacterized protein BDB00DRAFT_822676 [Zychaea mexicana]KAI9493585.1 hypothetical protein BDB00DRAFT_822676 [Zychaea mexicana]
MRVFAALRVLQLFVRSPKTLLILLCRLAATFVISRTYWSYIERMQKRWLHTSGSILDTVKKKVMGIITVVHSDIVAFFLLYHSVIMFPPRNLFDIL